MRHNEYNTLYSLFLNTADKMNSQITIRDWWDWIAEQFDQAELAFGHGTDNALDEAAWLIVHTLKISHEQFDEQLDRSVDAIYVPLLLSLTKERIQTRTPLAYLLKEAWFAGYPFYVDERVLIPRSPFAELIIEQFKPWCDPDELHTVLEIGTGSGCIAIVSALYLPHIHVDATDISEEALVVASRNVAAYQLQDRVHLIQSDLCSNLPKNPPKQYDLIVSNPPYVAADVWSQLAPEYQHEPSLGFLGGEDGLDLVKRLLQEAVPHLSPQGVIIVEVGLSQATMIEQFPQIPFVWIEFAEGGEGVFMLTADALRRAVMLF